MKKQMSSIFFLAGTAIGSGTIALPLVLAKFGVFLSAVIMCFFCWLTYITAIIRTDMNLQTSADFSLQEVANFFDRKVLSKISAWCLRLLSLSLLAAYLYGAASITVSMLENLNLPLRGVIFALTCLVFVLFKFPHKIILSINKAIFAFLLFSFFILIFGMAVGLGNINTEILVSHTPSLRNWCLILPIIFTSFGFQGSLHSLTKFNNNERVSIRKACLWGSIIPCIVYIIWITVVLVIVSNNCPDFFKRMLATEVEVGELIAVLARTFQRHAIQEIISIVSLLAIFTSIIGVGISLIDDLTNMFRNFSKSEESTRAKGNDYAKLNKKGKIFDLKVKLVQWSTNTDIIGKNTNFIIFITLFFPAIISLLVPNAFVIILNFSGIILAILAIVIPIRLLFIMKNKGFHSSVKKLPIIVVGFTGIIIIFAGLVCLVH